MQNQRVQSSCTKILSLLPPSHSPFSPSDPASTPSSPVPIAPRLLSHADAQPPAGRDTHAVTPWLCRSDRPMGNVAAMHGRQLHPNWASKRGRIFHTGILSWGILLPGPVPPPQKHQKLQVPHKNSWFLVRFFSETKAWWNAHFWPGVAFLHSFWGP